jgi:hypothetical protein
MQINLQLNINFDNNTLTVSGDSQGIYDLENALYKDDVLRDAVKGNTDKVEEAMLKIHNNELHRIIFLENYLSDDQKIAKSNFSAWFKDQNL